LPGMTVRAPSVNAGMENPHGPPERFPPRPGRERIHPRHLALSSSLSASVERDPARRVVDAGRRPPPALPIRF